MYLSLAPDILGSSVLGMDLWKYVQVSRLANQLVTIGYPSGRRLD